MTFQDLYAPCTKDKQTEVKTRAHSDVSKWCWLSHDSDR